MVNSVMTQSTKKAERARLSAVSAGFTLIELITATTILIILSAMGGFR